MTEELMKMFLYIAHIVHEYADDAGYGPVSSGTFKVGELTFTIEVEGKEYDE